MKFETREAWLIEAVQQMAAWFEVPLPKIQVSVGVQPGATTLATCYGDDKEPGHENYTANIYVTPSVVPENPNRLLDIVLHEMVHAANFFAGDRGHGKVFSAIAKPLGLQGKMSATTASVELNERLDPIAEHLEEFPHTPMDLASRGLGPSGKPKQTTRQKLVTCAYDKTYKIRMSQKQIDTVGTPLCPCHNEPMEAA